MSEHELRELIRGIVAEVLAETQATPAPAKPQGLVLFTGAMLGFETALESLKRLSASGVVGLDWTQTPSASHILDQEAIASVGMCPAADSLVKAHDVLIIPTLTVNLAAKVAHGIGDCLASNVVAEFVMQNKPVVVATDAACPDSVAKRGWFPELPEGYAQVLRGNLATLRSFGIKLSGADRLDAAVLKRLGAPAGAPTEASVCREKVVSEAVVSTLPQGSVLKVASGSLITALARESAAARNITFERVE